MIFDERIFINEIRKSNHIIIYGAGMVGGLVYKRLKNSGLDDKVLCFAVSHSSFQKEYMEKPVEKISDLSIYRENSLVIVAVFPELHQEMGDILNKYEFINILYITKNLYKDMALKYIDEFNKSVRLRHRQVDIMMMASDNNNSSGAFLCLVELNVMLKKQGWSTMVILPEYGNGEQELISNKIDYLYVPSYHWCIKNDTVEVEKKRRELKRNNAAIKRLEEIIEQYKVKIVHINTSYSYVGAVAAYNKNIPVIWHLRENIQMQKYRFFDVDISCHWMNRSAKIIPVSQYIKNAYTQIDPAKTVVVYDGVDVERYYKEREIIQNPLHISVIVVGAIFSLKGQEDIVNALHLLYAEYKINCDIRVRFVGNGDLKYIDYLKSLIYKYGLQKNICFCGHQSNVEKMYWESDIAIMSSRGDAFGRTTVEAQLAGCLVIGAKAGATKEIISSDETGVLYSPGNSDELAQKLKYAVENRDDMRLIAIRGQKNALRNFTKEKNAETVSKIYKASINKLNYRMFNDSEGF